MNVEPVRYAEPVRSIDMHGHEISRSPYRLPRSIKRAACLTVLLWLSGVHPLTAQQAVPCDTLLIDADEAYVDQLFDETVQLVDECLAHDDLSQDNLVAAYRLMALAYIRLDQLGDARLAIVRLLGAVPDYVPDPIADPPDYTVMVDAVKRQIEPASDESRQERSWFRANARWLVSGGAVLAGGVLAAVLRGSQGSSEGSSLPPPPNMPN